MRSCTHYAHPRRFVYDTHWFTPIIILAYVIVMRIVFVLALRYVSFLRR